jgi:hypothetical protein
LDPRPCHTHYLCECPLPFCRVCRTELELTILSFEWVHQL